jgi:hypothetical protein
VRQALLEVLGHLAAAASQAKAASAAHSHHQSHAQAQAAAADLGPEATLFAIGTDSAPDSRRLMRRWTRSGSKCPAKC